MKNRLYLIRFMLFIFLFMASFSARPGEFIVGVGSHFAFGMDEPVRTLDMLQTAGVGAFRDEVPWAYIETTKGVFKFPERLGWLEKAVDLAAAKGMEPLLILDYGNTLYTPDYPISDEAQAAFVRYAEFVVRHFKGRVKYYEVWNEWNLKGAAVDYVRLLKKVYPAIKKVDPSVVVLGGSVGGIDRPIFIETMIREGALTAMDGLSIHPYVYWKGALGTPELLVRYIDDLQKELLQKATGGKPFPIYITEAGWPTNKGELGIPQDQAGHYLVRTLLLLRTLPYVQGVWWYDFRNDGDNQGDREHNFGLVSKGYSPKPAYFGLQQIAGLARHATFLERIPSDADVWVLKFLKPDKSETLAAWQAASQGRWEFNLNEVPLRNSEISVRRTGKDTQAVMLQTTAQEEGHSFELSDIPLLIDSGKGPIKVKRISKSQ